MDATVGSKYECVDDLNESESRGLSCASSFPFCFGSNLGIFSGFVIGFASGDEGEGEGEGGGDPAP